MLSPTTTAITAPNAKNSPTRVQNKVVKTEP